MCQLSCQISPRVSQLQQFIFAQLDFVQCLHLKSFVLFSPGLLLVACSTDPFHLVDAGVAAAAALSGGAAPRSIKSLPSSLDGFGWCASLLYTYDNTHTRTLPFMP
jgi:hypothetical protein